MGDLRGKAAVVTGAASGIGLSIARRLVLEGMQVVLADIDERGLAHAVSTLERLGPGGVAGMPTDVASASSVRALAETTSRQFGNVHVLCNNAGIIRAGRTWEHQRSDWEAVMGVNLWGAVHAIQEFVPMMLEHGEPSHVVNIASLAGLVPARGFPSYSASKAALIALSESLAEDLRAMPGATVTVSVICPGTVETNIFRTEAERHRQRGDAMPGAASEPLSAPEPMDAFTPDEIADLAVETIHHPSLYVLPVQEAWQRGIHRKLKRVQEALDQTSRR